MTSNIDPMGIEIIPRDGESYKSIRSLTWNEVPGFAVLTGRNGSGKTHLLELLAHHFTGTFPPGPPDKQRLPVIVKVSGAEIANDEVGYIPSSGRLSGDSAASMADMRNLRQSHLQQAEKIQNYRHDPVQMAHARRMQRLLQGATPKEISLEEIDKYFPDDFSPLLADLDAVKNLATIFMAHRLKLLEALERGEPDKAKDGKDFGPAPWVVVNESLKVAGFPYQVVSPLETGFLQQYRLRLREEGSGIEIPPSNLSSGERVILQLMLWLFGVSKDGVFPKLLLLDEPDAHLHPSMTVQFLDVISEVLVKKHGVRVIMTTHSPSTVALAPENSIYQMERGSKSVHPVRDKAAIIGVLTAGLITVSRATKFCFVEDDGDVGFYEAVRDVLTDYGPSKDPRALKASPSLVFIAASVGQGAHKISGGCSNVTKWVEKLDADPLIHTFLGIIDRDEGNLGGPRVNVLGRYSFENYLLDPLNVFGLLLENGTHPNIPDLNVTSGEEHRLREQPAAILQQIVDVIVQRTESAHPHLQSSGNMRVVYTTGTEVSVPVWVADHRGHDLLKVMQGAWGGHQLITPPRLIKAMRRVRLIPLELASLLASLQT